MKIATYTITFNGLTEGTLEATIENLDEFAEHIVVCASEDSDDGTLEWCKNNDKIDSVVTEDFDFPEDEGKIRKKAFEEAKKFDPDWIAAIDDDEIIADVEEARSKLEMANDNSIKTCDLVAANLYHVWEGKKYRCDGTWKPREVVRYLFINMNTDFEGEFNTWSDIHAGRIPFANQNRNANVTGHIAVIHFGWNIEQQKREEKMEAKRKLDDVEGKESDYAEIQRKHYNSVYEEPTLEKLPEKWVNGREHLFKS